MARMLFRKMMRDIRSAIMTYILCILVTMLGLWGYSVLELCYDNLTLAKTLFFRQSDFCDGFIDTVYTDRSALNRLRALEGIAEAEGRLVRDVQIVGIRGEEIGGGAEFHLVSWEEGQMNRPVLSRGTMPEPGKAELVIGENMAKARQLKPGDSVEVAAGGRRVSMKIAGIGITPENIYMIRDMNELFPDPAFYDAAFTSYQTASWLAGRENSANSFLIRLEAGAAWEDVKDQIERVMEPYGLTGSYAADEQIGVAMIEEEIKQLEQMAGVVPVLFLAVAGVVLAITLSRMVEQQRTQIGTLKALGVPDWCIRAHYMGYGAVVGAAGGLLGCVTGYLSAGPMADFYRIYFSLPSVTTPLEARYLLTGTAGSAVFCGCISWVIAGNTGKIEPARALRPAPPGTASRSVLEKIPGFMGLLTVPGVMAVRSLSRNRKRTACSLAGMSIAYMLTATLVSMNAMFDVFVLDYWKKTQRQDAMVYFERPVRPQDAREVVRHPLVSAAEGVLEFPVTLAGKSGKMDCTVQAVRQDSSMIYMYRSDGTSVSVKEAGIVLTEHMAKTLGASRGDFVEVRVTYPKKKETRVVVTDVVAQYIGSTAYMSYDGAQQVSGYGNVWNGVLVRIPEAGFMELRGDLEGKGEVSLIQSRKERLKQYEAVMGSMSGILLSMSLIGAATGFAVVSVSSMIRFEEMKRELATLMQLGMSRRECLDVLSVSQWILAAGSVVIGIPLAMGTSRLITDSMSSDLYTIPNMLSRKAVIGAVWLIGASVWLGSAVMLRKLRKISPVDFLRERE